MHVSHRVQVSSLATIRLTAIEETVEFSIALYIKMTLSYFKLLSNLRWGTVTNVFAKAVHVMSTCPPESNCVVHSSIMCNNCNAVDLPLINQNWLWSPYGIGQTIIFSSCCLFYLLSSFFSSPNLSSRRVDVCHSSTHAVALVWIYDAGLKHAARGSQQIQDAKNCQKFAIWAPSHNIVGLYLRN